MTILWHTHVSIINKNNLYQLIHGPINYKHGKPSPPKSLLPTLVKKNNSFFLFDTVATNKIDKTILR